MKAGFLGDHSGFLTKNCYRAVYRKAWTETYLKDVLELLYGCLAQLYRPNEDNFSIEHMRVYIMVNYIIVSIIQIPTSRGIGKQILSENEMMQLIRHICNRNTKTFERSGMTGVSSTCYHCSYDKN